MFDTLTNKDELAPIITQLGDKHDNLLSSDKLE